MDKQKVYNPERLKKIADLKRWIRNTGKLRNYIKTSVPANAYNHDWYGIKRPECGTVGCAIGWAGMSGKFNFRYRWIDRSGWFTNLEGLPTLPEKLAVQEFGPYAYKRVFGHCSGVKTKTDALRHLASHKRDLLAQLEELQ